mmetsp:Transcript_33417/g.80796  ORF Transcript_33417/g.80796 Transcript_33417/m.80796 type:complete len:108 (-) Transcript_33417:999-1322(-)
MGLVHGHNFYSTIFWLYCDVHSMLKNEEVVLRLILPILIIQCLRLRSAFSSGNFEILPDSGSWLKRRATYHYLKARRPILFLVEVSDRTGKILVDHSSLYVSLSLSL